MRKKRYLFQYLRYCNLIFFLGIFLSCTTTPVTISGWDQVPRILARIVPPEFPDQDFNVSHFGAIGDGKTDCTEALRTAIAACHDAGGGRVVVAAGRYLTGPIYLKSHVNLHIEKEAVLLFSQNMDDYLPVVFTRFEGVECMNYSPLIYAFEQENIAITGAGTLDGQAGNDVWWSWCGKPEYGRAEGAPSQYADVARVYQMPEDGIPVSERIFGKGHYLRPNFIQPYRCRNILIEGITILRSPMWVIHPVLCENVKVQNVTVISHGPNNDGCNPESSKNVWINNCYFDTGDDCIAIKSGRNADGRRLNMPSENIVIQNCTMRDGHGGVVMGSEMTGGCRNIFAENCTMDSPNLERALRIKTNSLRGGVVENIFMRNVTVGEVSESVIHIYFHYGEGDVGKNTPIVRNVYVDHVTSQKSRYALLLDGYERSPISNINLAACTFNGVQEGNILNHVSNFKVRDVTINGALQVAETMFRESKMRDE